MGGSEDLFRQARRLHLAAAVLAIISATACIALVVLLVAGS